MASPLSIILLYAIQYFSTSFPFFFLLLVFFFPFSTFACICKAREQLVFVPRPKLSFVFVTLPPHAQSFITHWALWSSSSYLLFEFQPRCLSFLIGNWWKSVVWWHSDSLRATVLLGYLRRDGSCVFKSPEAVWASRSVKCKELFFLFFIEPSQELPTFSESCTQPLCLIFTFFTQSYTRIWPLRIRHQGINLLQPWLEHRGGFLRELKTIIKWMFLICV